jgi:hypothetical protein
MVDFKMVWGMVFADALELDTLERAQKKWVRLSLVTSSLCPSERVVFVV